MKIVIIRTISALIFATIVFSSSIVSAQNKGDGKLNLFSYQTNEVLLDVVYRTDKGYDAEGLGKIDAVMRSPDGKVKSISIKLIELLDLIQDHFGAETVEIISGYRSPQYNKGLRDNGRKTARESLHMKGTAADIHLDEVTEKAIRDYVASLKSGGVGYYPRYNFVHVDAGPYRVWEEKKQNGRILVGTENNPNKAWRAVTDKNEYFKGDKIKVTITNESYDKQKLVKNIWWEYFRKGDWAKHDVLKKEKKSKRLKPNQSVTYELDLPNQGKYGKYRLVIFTSKDFSIPPAISNEFYLKKE